MHDYPLDHPLQRIALAYFENYEDEMGIRYALQALESQLKQYDFDEEEFRDCLDLIVNELLYNEEELLIAGALHTLSILILKKSFPESYRAPTIERLAMIEKSFKEEGVVLASLVECLLAVWIHWDEAPPLQAQAKELLDLLHSDETNVSRLKALARGYGLSVLMPGVSDAKVVVCLEALQGLLKRNDDWRVSVHVTQSLSLLLGEGFVASQEKLIFLMDLVEGFLGDDYPQLFCRPVAEFFSKVLTLGNLDEAQNHRCWGVLFRLPRLVREGATQCAALHQLGIAMHWKAMTPEQEDQCYDVFREILDNAEEEKTLYEMMIVLAQAIAGMYSWGRIESLQRWGSLFAELILEVNPPAAYSLFATFLQGPMAKVCFTRKDLDLLANDVLCFAERDEKQRFLCVRVLDGMVSSSLLHEAYFQRFWALLYALWTQETAGAYASFWEYLSRSASGLVTDLDASASVRRRIFEAMVSLLNAGFMSEEKRLPLVQTLPVLVALSASLPDGVFEASVDELLSLLEDPSPNVRMAALDGIEGALRSADLKEETLALIAEALLGLDVSSAEEGVLAAYVLACRSLEDHKQASESIRAAAKERFSSIPSSARGRRV